MTSTLKQKEILGDVVLIRLTLVVCLVVYHAFAPYCGAWKQVTDEFIPAYYWIGKFAYSFFLGAFVFISGFILRFQEQRKGESLFWPMARKKPSD